MDDAPEKSAAENPSTEPKPVRAWQPFTPKGVAAFATATVSHLLALQFFVSLVASAIVIWFCNANYSPAILEAIRNTPDEVVLEQGTLTNVSSQILTEKKFLSIAIDLEETGQLGKISDLQMELRQNYLQICSLFGCALFDYPKENIILGRSTSEPWWGARQPVIFAFIGVGTLIGVWLSWFLFALIYTPIVKLIAFFEDRELSWTGSWKLSCAAQLFAALLMSFAILLYGLQAFDLIRFLFFFTTHFVVAWIYLGASPYFLPAVSAKTSAPKNPFGTK